MKQVKRIDSDRYDFAGVEKRWRAYWDDIDLYRTGSDPRKPNIYILDFFPYPSGAGLSVGHCRNYIPTCVSARFHRMRGYNVLHPMGWDAFGLPAENYAIRHKIHPRESSAQFCATYKRQMELIACSYDWSREFSSAGPDFYRWTQWFFLLLYERGLAYRAISSQWWCPECQTILANEQVENSRCWRCDSEVEKKELEQWHLRITDYADRLLQDLETIDWPEAIKRMQRNWIGRSEGVEISFSLNPDQGKARDSEAEVVVFTTRPDTLYGATFLVLAPEHPLAERVATADRADAVRAMIDEAGNRSERERSAENEQMRGEFSGRYAAHPMTGEPVPIWVADYVLPGYGTGAIMAVPAHDDRDYAFAKAHDLPIVEVVGDAGAPDDGRDAGGTDAGGPDAGGPDAGGPSFSGHGVLMNSGRYDGERSESAGAPIPMIQCPECGVVPVLEEDLPVLLPDSVDFASTGDGRSPLARVSDWVNTSCPKCGGPARRETDTMDGFACSSWYPLRFTNPHYDDGPFDPEAMRTWMPVDTYVGGAEHAVMHLLYARFWTKVLFDAGLVPFVEPFTQLLNQGVLHSAVDGQRMSKSRGNVVTPDEVVAAQGTDALRVYVLFLGPFDSDVVWDDRGIRGITRFLNRFWRLASQSMADLPQTGAMDEAFERRRQQTIKRVTEDMVRYRYNTAVATLLAYLNYLNESRWAGISRSQWRAAVETLTVLLCPMAPFISEEVWQKVLGYRESVHQQAWPCYDEALAAESTVTIIVQVNGRVRERLQSKSGASEDSLRALALGSIKVQRYLAGKDVRQIIVVADRLVNFVV